MLAFLDYSNPRIGFIKSNQTPQLTAFNLVLWLNTNFKNDPKIRVNYLEKSKLE